MIRARPARCAGFTLTEMMVALAIGLVILASLVTVLANSRKNYSVQDSLARLQENARFAMQFITKDLRMTGYYGCADDITTVENQLKLSDPNNAEADFSDFEAGTPLEGLEALADPSSEAWLPSGNTEFPSNRIPGTDAIVVRYLDPNGIALIEEMPSEAADLKVEKNLILQEGDVVMVTDCSSADIFQITNYNTSGQNKDELVHNPGTKHFPGNDPAFNPHKLSKVYGVDAEIMVFRSMLYYIGAGANDNPALFRQRLITTSKGAIPTPEELVEGIENMQILYGEDTLRNDRIPDVYRTAADVENWPNVVAVRVVMLAYSISSATESGEYYSGADDTAYNLAFSDSVSGEVSGTTGDRKRRRFIATTFLRNIR